MAEALARRGNIFGNVTQADSLGFLLKYSSCDEAVAQAVAERKELRAAIKAAGIPLKAWDRYRKDRDNSGEIRETNELWYRRLMEWDAKPVGFQASLDVNQTEVTLKLSQVEMKRIDKEGNGAGKGGRPRESNPYTPGTEAQVRWDQAWLKGTGQGEEKPAGKGKRGAGMRVVEGGRSPAADKKEPESTEQSGEAGTEDAGYTVAAGKAAARAGQAADANPHPAGHPSHDLWQSGWDQGMALNEQERQQGDSVH